MTDILLRAWELLTPEERAATLLERDGPYLWDWDGGWQGVRVSLIVAVEDALLRMDDGGRKWLLTMHGDEYVWSHVSRGLKFCDRDRLTAGVLALEAWRKQ